MAERNFCSYWRAELSGPRAVRARRVGQDCREPAERRFDLFLGGDAIALFQCRHWPLSGGDRAGPQKRTKAAFDGNFRPRGWRGDPARTRTVFAEALKRVDIALPTFEDEASACGHASPEANGGHG